MKRWGAWAVAGGAGLALLGAGACHTEPTVTHYRPFFSNIPEAQTGTPAVGDLGEGGADYAQVAPDAKLVVEKPDGSKVLIARSVHHLMRHLEHFLDEGESDQVIIDQLFSRQLHAHLGELGAEPQEYVDYLRRGRKDLALLFARLPMGERSPSAVFEKTGKRQYVLKITGTAARDLRWTRLWVVMENGNWKLTWVS
ncbi:MAG TPA: hypothetical protein VD963_03150 [Phycisphaerales bacterium]|nr:hypothetical protein [Phycisphaerales bacterium]